MEGSRAFLDNEVNRNLPMYSIWEGKNREIEVLRMIIRSGRCKMTG